MVFFCQKYLWDRYSKKLTKKQIEHIFQRLVRKGSDYVMEQFWSVIECEIDNVMYEVKEKCVAKGEVLK